MAHASNQVGHMPCGRGEMWEGEEWEDEEWEG